MTRQHAAYLSLALMLTASTFVAYQLGRGHLRRLERFVMAFDLLGYALLWLRTNAPFEGTVLVLVSPSHGLTAGDFLATFPVVLAAVAVAPYFRRANRYCP